MNSSYGEASFRAAPPKGSTETFSFAAAGDWGNSQGTADTSNAIKAVDPNLLLPLGDLYYSPNETIVKQIFQKWQAFGQSSFVEPALGNHDHPSTQMWRTDEEIHCAFVNLPGNERTYAFTFGNTLFLSIDWGLWSNNTSDGVDGTGSSCGGVSGTAAIRSWVDARLAAANLDPNITWKVVFQHFQCYDMTTVNYFPMCPSPGHPLDQMEDILTNRGVDLVLQAHEHTYSRSHPVKFHNVVQNGTSYDTPGAPVYFVLGTGGDPVTAACRDDPGCAVCRAPAALVIAATNASVSKTVAFHLTVTDRVTRTFRKGDGGAFSETDDTYLYNGAPDANFGADPKLYVDNADCIAKATICKVLLKFPQIIGPDPAQIPANSTIARATLDLTVLNAGVKQDLYQVTEAWNESTATWNGFATPGQPTTRAREYTFYPTALGKMSLNLTSIVQRWTNGDSNQGILLASTHWDGVDYGSSESTTKPTLTVAFDPPAPLPPPPPPPPPPPFDFTVSASPSSSSVEAGNSTRANVTATLTSGSPQAIQFACEDLPDEATCTFTPTTCGPPCTADLILGTSLNTSEGSYDVVIRASDGNISRTANFTLNISTPPAPPPEFDFTMSIDPTSASVAPGAAVNATVTETILSGSTDDVQYSCAKLAGVA